MVCHILRTVVGSLLRKRAKTVRQHVCDRKLAFGEEVLNFSDPLYTNEACADNQDRFLAFVQLLDGCVLFQDMPTAALEVSLIKMWPAALELRRFVNRGKP